MNKLKHMAWLSEYSGDIFIQIAKVGSPRLHAMMSSHMVVGGHAKRAYLLTILICLSGIGLTIGNPVVAFGGGLLATLFWQMIRDYLWHYRRDAQERATQVKAVYELSQDTPELLSGERALQATEDAFLVAGINRAGHLLAGSALSLLSVCVLIGYVSTLPPLKSLPNIELTTVLGLSLAVGVLVAYHIYIMIACIKQVMLGQQAKTFINNLHGERVGFVWYQKGNAQARHWFTVTPETQGESSDC